MTSDPDSYNPDSGTCTPAKRRSVASLAFALNLGFAPAAIAQHPSDVLFDQGVLQTIRVTMAPLDWDRLVQEVTENTVYPCTFEWHTTRFENIGVRIKGQGSRLSDSKPSLRFKFNEYSDQKLFSLTRLDAQAMKMDPSMMRERLIYDVFRRRGVLAPRAMHVRIEVNSKYIGLYTILDQFDQAEALRMRFPSSKGNLYKCDQFASGGDVTSWRGSDQSAYLGVMYEWERAETSTAADLVNLLDKVNNLSDVELEQTLPSVLDVNLMLEYCAINQILANEDWMFSDVTLWQAPVVRGGAWGHNFYWYFEPTSGRASVLVWDVDVTMSYVWTPGRWFERSIYLGFDRSVLGMRLMANPGWRQSFDAKVLDTLDDAFDPRLMVGHIDRIYEQIKAAAEQDTWKPYSNVDFHSGVSALRQDLPTRVANVRSELGYPGSSFESFGDGCPGTDSRIPEHFGSGLAVPGRTCSLRLAQALPGADAVLFLALSARAIDLTAIGMSGCSMLVAPILAQALRIGADGTCVVPLLVPNDPSLVGHTCFSQVAVIDAGGPPLGVVTSNGLETHFGEHR